MSRRCFQRVTLSVELTLPPGAKAKDAPAVLKHALKEACAPTVTGTAWKGLSVEQSIIKIIKRETIYP